MSQRLPITWGTEMIGSGAARFRLWAPGQKEVGLLAHGRGETQAMLAGEDGWFEIETDLIRPGDGYSFVLADDLRVPDPAARAQLGDVNGPSRLVDPDAYEWRLPYWKGLPWHEAVIYELHTGTFSMPGTFDGVRARLDHLASIGVTAIELMPVAQFAGNRGWGYDGVLHYAPHSVYGGPEQLKRLVDAAHERGLMVFLDVVYNHFGPEGNYLWRYVPQFFHPERKTPWGGAIAFEKHPVRRYFIDNALYWIGEYLIDGLRFDAVDQIQDQAGTHLLDELALEVRQRFPGRHIHLATEDDRNMVRHIERDASGAVMLHDAEWNDDFHHAAHVIATGEDEGYYSEYVSDRLHKLARALSEGFIFQGEVSKFRNNQPRGEASGHLPPTAFVHFLQNHDQIGNRAFGDRLSDLAPPRIVEALTALLLLSPQIPLLFMGEEWGERTPFVFFCDFHGELAAAVREGRRREFARWSSFKNPQNRELIPDPNALSTFLDSKLEWSGAETEEGEARLQFVSRLLEIRRREIMPRLAGMQGRSGAIEFEAGTLIVISWRMGDRSILRLFANLGDHTSTVPASVRAGEASQLLFESVTGAHDLLRRGTLPEWSAVFLLTPPDLP
jgi:malto-oligosyltrehalose trehalohydrolase